MTKPSERINFFANLERAARNGSMVILTDQVDAILAYLDEQAAGSPT